MIEYTVKVHENGDKEWYLNGKRHRVDGPAIEYAGYEAWYLNGKLHRVDGPAIEYAGYEEWYLNGKRHRENGPAAEYVNGDKEWYLNGKRLTEEEFNARTSKSTTCNGKTVEIDGKKYQLVEV